MSKHLFFALFLLIFNKINAQSYKTAAGIRLGAGIGVSLNQHLWENNTLEIIARPGVTKSQHFGLTAVMKSHQKLLTRATNWYVGGGGHYYFKNENDDADFVNPAGLTGILGVEATLGKLNFSFDWKPEYHLAGGDGDNFDAGAGVTLRYVFKKRERKKIFDKDNFKLPKRDKSSTKKRKTSRS